MTEEVMKQVREELKSILSQTALYIKEVQEKGEESIEVPLTYGANQILSIPEIRIEDPDQSLPLPAKQYYSDLMTSERLAYNAAQQDMLKDNWVKMLLKKGTKKIPPGPDFLIPRG